jgi:ABC-type lipoprotein release transport system permease subunit
MRLSYIARLALLHLFRSWRATMVLAFLVITAVSALVFLGSLAIGTNDAMIRNSTGLFSGQILGSTLPRMADAAILDGPGIDKVLVRREQRFLLQAKDQYESILLVGVEPLPEKQQTALWRKTVAGRYLRPGEQAIYLNQQTAERLQVAVNDEVRVSRGDGSPLQPLTVVGIYRTGVGQLDQGMAFCPIETFPDATGLITTAIFVEDGSSLEEIVRRCQERIPAAQFMAWPEFMPDLKQLIDLNFVCMALVMILVFALVAVGISCAFLIFALKNLKEHGIMKTMGMMPLDTALFLVNQTGLLSCCGAVAGTLAGFALVAFFAGNGIDLTSFTSHNQYFAVSGVIYPRMTGPALLTPPLLAILFGLAAPIWPILYIIRRNPAEILRNV